MVGEDLLLLVIRASAVLSRSDELPEIEGLVVDGTLLALQPEVVLDAVYESVVSGLCRRSCVDEWRGDAPGLAEDVLARSYSRLRWDFVTDGADRIVAEQCLEVPLETLELPRVEHSRTFALVDQLGGNATGSDPSIATNSVISAAKRVTQDPHVEETLRTESRVASELAETKQEDDWVPLRQ